MKNFIKNLLTYKISIKPGMDVGTAYYILIQKKPFYKKYVELKLEEGTYEFRDQLIMRSNFSLSGAKDKTTLISTAYPDPRYSKPGDYSKLQNISMSK